MPILWETPDGTVRIMHLSDKFLAAQRSEDETTTEAVLRLLEGEREKNTDLRDAVPVLVASSDMPTNREKRYAWRLRDGRCVVDETIPEPVRQPDAITQRLASLDERLSQLESKK